MKFVKTKDGHIYDVSNLNVEGNLKDGLKTEMFVAHSGKAFGSYLNGLGAISLTKLLSVNDIEKESDTIEELCDEYVIYAEDCKPCKYFLSQGHKEDILANPNIDLREYLKTRSIYGAIWTAKGLIYVAKMNEKGEFELL